MKRIASEPKNRLMLYPISPEYRLPGRETLSTFLHDIGLVDGEAPGRHFMKLLTFMGCSPSIGSDRDTDSVNNYSVEIEYGDGPTLLATPQLRAPVCPACGQRASDTRVIEGINLVNGRVSWRCPVCRRDSGIGEINWRHKLGIACDYIIVHGVFEGEVIPSDALLDRLAGFTNIGWTYCYC